MVLLGALTTILALAVDPFAQQLVQYEHQPAFQTSNDAFIARADRYSKGGEYTIYTLTGISDEGKL